MSHLDDPPVATREPDAVDRKVVMTTEQTCPKCGETVAAANLRCRSCGLPRSEFASYVEVDGSDRSDSDDFQLGQMKPGSSTGFQLPPIDGGEPSGSEPSGSDRAGADSQFVLGTSSADLGQILPAERQGAASEQRAGVESDPDLLHDPGASHSEITSSASRITLRVTCEHCSTVNPVPKTLIHSGVGCVRCGRPLAVASTDSSTSTTQSAFESQIVERSTANRRKHLKRAVEKALLATDPKTSIAKHGKVLPSREWKSLKSDVEAGKDDATNPAVVDAAKAALETLGASNDRRAVDFLVSSVESFPDAIRGEGKAALGQLKAQTAFGLLSQSLVDDIPETYPAIVRGLGDLGDRRATRTLLVIGTYWSELKEDALKSLVKLGTAALPELLTLAERKDKHSLHPFAAEALGEIADPQATQTLATILKSDRRPEARSTAAIALGKIPDRNVLAPLVSGLKDKDDSVRIATTEALASHPRKRIVPALVHVLNDPNATVRENAARLLGRCGVTKALTPLGLVSSDSDKKVRVAVLEAMARLGDETAVPQLGFLLTEACDDGEQNLITSIAASLGELKDSRAILPILNAMPKQLPVVQSKMIAALGEIGDASVVSALVDLIEKGTSPATRVAAVTSLGKIGDESALPALMRALQSGPPMRPAAITALGGVKSEEAVTALADLLGNPEANTRRLAAAALGENGNESVFRKLRPLLEDADDRVAEKARESLVKLGDSETINGPEQKSVKQKPKKSKKVKVRKASKRKLQMPSFNFETLQSLTPNDFVTLASEFKAVTAAIAAVAVLTFVGFFFGRSIFNNTFTGGLDANIIVRGPLVDVALSPDGTKLAMTREAGVLDIYDLTVGGVILDKRGPASGLVEFGANPNELLTNAGKKAGRWNLETGEFQPIEPFSSVIFNADRSEFLSLEGQAVFRYDAATGTSERYFSLGRPPGVTADGGCIAATPDFSKVLVGYPKGFINVYVAERESTVTMNVGVDSAVTRLDVSDDGSLLAIGLFDGTFISLEAGGKEPLVKLEPPSKDVFADVVFVEGDTVLATRRENTVMLDARTGEIKLEISPQCGSPALVSISADGSRVAFAAYEGKKVAIHSLTDGSLVEVVEVPNLRR